MNKKCKKNHVALSIGAVLFTKLAKLSRQKKSKKIIFMLDGCTDTCYHVHVTQKGCKERRNKMAARMRDKNKRLLSFYIPIETYQAFKKKAEQLGSNMTELLTLYIVKETMDIELTKEDYEEIIAYKEGRD